MKTANTNTLDITIEARLRAARTAAQMPASSVAEQLGYQVIDNLIADATETSQGVIANAKSEARHTLNNQS